MSNLDKIKSAFQKEGYKSKSYIKRVELEQLLNRLVKGEYFDQDVAGQIWEQAAEGRLEIPVEQVCLTIVEAQTIVKQKIIQLKEIISALDQEGAGVSRTLQAELQEREEQKKSFQEDLRLLTEPFGISMSEYLGNGGKSRYTGQNFETNADKNQQNSEVELKWLFYLCLAFAFIQIIVIYRKYDFLNLMVVACILSIFLMNQFESTYIKFSLGLLIASEILDMIWVFMNANDYWSPPAVGTSSRAENGYLKFIIILTFAGIFVKIPLGVFLYHYRNVEEKDYHLDLGLVKMQLTPNNTNPMSQTIKKMEIGN